MKKRTPKGPEVKPSDEWTDGLLWSLAKSVLARAQPPEATPKRKWTSEMLAALAEEVCARADREEAAERAAQAAALPNNVIRFPVERRIAA